jgi:hypothetical protein
MNSTTDARCEFCDGTGRWTDEAAGTDDQCLVCEGTGTVRTSGAAATLGDDLLLITVAALTQRERQQLYEELYRRWNCRMYKA